MSMLSKYRQGLVPGNVALLGTLTDGGVGLQTGNNGRFVGVREKSKPANAIRASRPNKLYDTVLKYRTSLPITCKNDAVSFLSKKTERDIVTLFDNMKE